MEAPIDARNPELVGFWQSLNFELEGDLAVLEIEQTQRQAAPPKPLVQVKSKTPPKSKADAPPPSCLPTAIPAAGPVAACQPVQLATATTAKRKRDCATDEATPKEEIGVSPRTSAPAFSQTSVGEQHRRFGEQREALSRVFIRKYCAGLKNSHLVRTMNGQKPDEETWAHVPEEELKKQHRVQCMVCKLRFSITREEAVESDSTGFQ